MADLFNKHEATCSSRPVEPMTVKELKEAIELLKEINRYKIVYPIGIDFMAYKPIFTGICS